VTCVRARVRERRSCFGHELPVVARRVQGQPEDAEGSVVAHLAVGGRARERRVIGPARADNELADATHRVSCPGRRLRGEALVGVVVPG
jgi:hypothetical protein